MKKVLILLVICALAAPVFADGTVTISAEDDGADVNIILTVDTADAGDGPVGFALDITATDPDKDLTDTVVVDSFFDIFIDLAFDEENGDGYLYAEGDNAVCKVGAAGQINTAGSAASVADAMAGDRVYAVCAGGLGGETGTPADPPTGAITLLTISGEGGATADITLNDIRGGIVFKAGGTVTVNGLPLSITIPDDGPTECLKDTAPGYATWVAFGKPDCWCYAKQCKGDANGKALLNKAVNITDLNILKAAYNKTVTELQTVLVGDVPGICADFNHVGLLGKQVNITDLNTLKINYNNLGVPDCDMTNHNFWIVP